MREYTARHEAIHRAGAPFDASPVIPCLAFSGSKATTDRAKNILPMSILPKLLPLLALLLTACPPKQIFHWNPSGTLLSVDLHDTGLITHSDGKILRESPYVGPWVDDRRMLIVEKTAATDWAAYSEHLTEEQKKVAQSLVPAFAKVSRDRPDFGDALLQMIRSPKEDTDFPVPVDVGIPLGITHTASSLDGDERSFLASVATAQMLANSEGEIRSALASNLKKAGILQSGPLQLDGFPSLPIYEIRLIDSEPGSDLPPRTLHRGILPPEKLTVSPDKKTATFTTTVLTGSKTVFLSVNAQSPGPEGTAEHGPVITWVHGGRSVVYKRQSPSDLEFRFGKQLEGLGELTLHLDHTGGNALPIAHLHIPSDESSAPAAKWGNNGLIFTSASQTLPALKLDRSFGLFSIDDLPRRTDDPANPTLRPLDLPKGTLEAIQFSGNIVSNPSGTAALLLGKNGELAIIEHGSLRSRIVVREGGLHILPVWKNDTDFIYAVAAGHPDGAPKRPAVLEGTLDGDHRILSSTWPDTLMSKLAK